MHDFVLLVPKQKVGKLSEVAAKIIVNDKIRKSLGDHEIFK